MCLLFVLCFYWAPLNSVHLSLVCCCCCWFIAIIQMWFLSLSRFCGIILICANLFHQMRNSRGVGADYRLARSCSSLIAHLDPADVLAPVPARASRLALLYVCVLVGVRGGGEVMGTPPLGFWTVLDVISAKVWFNSFIYLQECLLEEEKNT